MKKLAALAAVLGAVILGACTPQQQMVGPVVAAPMQRPMVQQACDTRFRFLNNSGSTITRIQFSSVRRNDWGVDQLGRRVLRPGQSITFRAANADRYDFRVTYANGRIYQMRGVDICRVRQINAFNNGLRAI